MNIVKYNGVSPILDAISSIEMHIYDIFGTNES